jgi:hypothetical protein
VSTCKSLIEPKKNNTRSFLCPLFEEMTRTRTKVPWRLSPDSITSRSKGQREWEWGSTSNPSDTRTNGTVVAVPLKCASGMERPWNTRIRRGSVRRLYNPNHSSNCGRDDWFLMSRLLVLVRRARRSSHWGNSIGRRPNLAATWALGKIL